MVRIARARGPGRSVRVTEVHLLRIDRLARVGPLVVGVGPLGRIRVRRRLVEGRVHVALLRRLLLGHAFSLVAVLWPDEPRTPLPVAPTRNARCEQMDTPAATRDPVGVARVKWKEPLHS